MKVKLRTPKVGAFVVGLGFIRNPFRAALYLGPWVIEVEK